MTKILYIGDLHLGAARATGTTTESVLVHEEQELLKLEKLIREVSPDVTFFLGDIFDKSVVSEILKVNLIRLFNSLDCDIICLAGNHDRKSFDSKQMCSLELVGELSKAEVIFQEPKLINNHFCIPHVFNQQRLDECLKEVPPNCTVLLHCNIESGFAAPELSLNLDRNQIDTLIANGNTIICGHEHSFRELYQGKLIALGCHIVTSISDTETDKFVMIREDGVVSFNKCWDKTEKYIKVPWTELHTITDQSIIEVTGEVTVSESIEAAKAVSQLRKTSKAFIVKNSAKIFNKDLEVNAEDVTNFNIMEIFKAALDEETKSVVEEIVHELSTEA